MVEEVLVIVAGEPELLNIEIRPREFLSGATRVVGAEVLMTVREQRGDECEVTHLCSRYNFPVADSAFERANQWQEYLRRRKRN